MLNIHTLYLSSAVLNFLGLLIHHFAILDFTAVLLTTVYILYVYEIRLHS